MSRIRVDDFTVSESFSNALVCRSERTEAETGVSTHGYLQADGNSPITGGDGPAILPYGDSERGWDTRRGTADNQGSTI